MPLLFVYGTLKRGFPLNAYMKGAEFLGLYRTLRRYPLLIAGSRYAPMLLDRPGEGHNVQGELFDVSLEKLATLDILESVGTPGNTRGRIDIEVLGGGGASIRAAVYFKGAPLADPAHSDLLPFYLADPRFVMPGLPDASRQRE